MNINLFKKYKLIKQITSKPNKLKKAKQNPKEITEMMSNMKNLLLKIQKKEEFDLSKESNSYRNQIESQIDDESQIKIKTNQEEVRYPDHYPVLYKEIIKRIRENNIVKESKDKDFDMSNTPFLVGDFTFGMGNLSIEILKTFKNSNIIGVDIDNTVLLKANEKETVKEYINQSRLKTFNDNYTEASSILSSLSKRTGRNKSITPLLSKFKSSKLFDYIILDLGFNSFHLSDQDKRGFSYMNENDILDMRFDNTNAENASAAEILNNSSALELIHIFKNFGDEKYSDLLVENILKYRLNSKFHTVKDLTNIIDSTFSHSVVFKNKFNCYARIFQALRIAVNYELLNIKRFFSIVNFVVERECLLFVISFHSLEDKIVKTSMNTLQKLNLGEVYCKKIVPNDEEIQENSKSKSAIMRVFRFYRRNDDV